MTPTTGTNQFTDPRYKDAFLRKKRAAQELGEALARYLSVEADTTLEYIEDIARTAPPREEWLLNELSRAQSQLDEVQASLDAIDNSDESVRPMLNAMRGPIVGALNQAKEYRDSIQRQLESLKTGAGA